jgi:hypothetical protein
LKILKNIKNDSYSRSHTTNNLLVIRRRVRLILVIINNLFLCHRIYIVEIFLMVLIKSKLWYIFDISFLFFSFLFLCFVIEICVSNSLKICYSQIQFLIKLLFLIVKYVKPGCFVENFSACVIWVFFKRKMVCLNQGCQFYSVSSRMVETFHTNSKNKTKQNNFHLILNLSPFRIFQLNFDRNVPVLFYMFRSALEKPLN